MCRVEGAPLEANQRRIMPERDLEASLGCVPYKNNLEIENQIRVSWMITPILSFANLQGADIFFPRLFSFCYLMVSISN